MKSKLVVHYLALRFLFTIQLCLLLCDIISQISSYEKEFKFFWIVVGTERRTLINISCSRTYSDLHQGFSYIFVAKKRESYKKAKTLRVWKLSVLVGYPLELDIFDLCSEDRRKKFEAPRQLGIQFCKEQLKGRRCEMTDVEVHILVYLGTGKSSTSDQHGGIFSEEHLFNIFLV
ncbi:BnaA05g36730D [Brassica napus]|uniref:(rape) hypothetical protein n=1 Tax=Brassica napus TaxID=3708 RepID=A0A078IN95_BRANA|nr:unnamed protein product [Brassica napus]CDY51456.1 BnaA05g36730D [Brassica napus]